MEVDTFYHIYNRGINRENIFKKEKNYPYFLRQYKKYIQPIAKTYAYCLLHNHFHFLIQTKKEFEMDASNISYHFGNQFAKLFNSYTQSINKSIGRTGGLFENRFRRKQINEESHLSRLIWYIHFNPQKHGLISDYRKYKHSSYHSLLSDMPTNLNRSEVIDWFGSKERLVKFHDELSLDFDKMKRISFLDSIFFIGGGSGGFKPLLSGKNYRWALCMSHLLFIL